MLGSINTGGFSKSLVDAMKDSNYFERKGVEGVYEPRNTKAPIVTGSFKGDSKGFLDKFKEGALSNLEKSKDKSDTDKYLDFLRESRGMMGGNAQFGNFGSGMATEVAQGLNVYQPPSPNQQMFIPGQEGKPGMFSLGGAIKGGIGGFLKGGPAGALGGAAIGGFM
tara:strand:- start:577 stop:1074 length:498 start_codon:yes stop_codon:yes gene_type:complete